LREILELDPLRDAQRIVYLDLAYEFPFDTTRSLELALFRTFGSPASRSSSSRSSSMRQVSSPSARSAATTTPT